MNIYIHLFHGYNLLDEELNDWGFLGPVLGPYEGINTDSIFNVFEGLTIKIESLSKEINIPPCNYFGAIPLLGSYFGLTDVLNEKDLTKDKKDKIEKTKKILSTPYNNINNLLNDPDEWVRNFAKFVIEQKET